MLWPDLVILALLIYAAYLGYRYGFLMVAIDLVGFVAAALIAAIAYRPVGNFLASHAHLSSALSRIVAYGLFWFFVEAMFYWVIRAVLRRISPAILQAPLNRWAGVPANVIKNLFLVALSLVLLAGLPMPKNIKDDITTARIPKYLLSLSSRVQTTDLLGKDIVDTLNFFSVKPESHELIQLGFHVTNVSVCAADEQQMFALINHERTSRGLKALSFREDAQGVARAHDRDMFARGYFSHDTPEGIDPFERLQAAGVKFNAAGENLALAPTLALAHNGLMNSPGHKANILSTEFGAVGIGCIDGGQYGLMFAQEFTD